MKKLPQEIATFYVIPAVRREFVKELILRGLSQRQAAQKLGLTDAAVSQYIADKRASEVKLSIQILGKIKLSVTNVLEKNSDVFAEVYKIVSECEKDLTICKIHAIYDDVPDGCNVCIESNNQLVQISKIKKLEGKTDKLVPL